MTPNVLKILVTACLIPASTFAIAQGNDMKGMKAMDRPAQTSATPQAIHVAEGVVKAVNTKVGEVTIAHGPIKTLNWPAMTMTFMVRDKTLFNHLVVGEKINFKVAAIDHDYVVTAAK